LGLEFVPKKGFIACEVPDQPDIDPNRRYCLPVQLVSAADLMTISKVFKPEELDIAAAVEAIYRLLPESSPAPRRRVYPSPASRGG